uniref:Small ribosomal subunit protein RACK1 n=1 Tax=Lygus hesperus TaxID=30085 RepID=A0A0A9XRS2_LYGHE
MVAIPTGTLTLVNELRGHNGWVTAIAVGRTEETDLVISASRDKSLIIWDTANNIPKKRLIGHNHFVQDVAITPDCKHAISGSWDGSLRLWDLQQGVSKIRFVGHTKDVLSVSFSQDSRRILSSSRDRTIKVWNTLGNCVYTYYDIDRHCEWVSVVRFTMAEDHSFVSAGWDKVIKVWGADQPRARFTLVGHTGHINA